MLVFVISTLILSVTYFQSVTSVSYIHSLRELHTFYQKYLGLNNVTFVFHSVIQVAPIGRQSVKIVMYIFKEFDLIMF